jgi:hypothetical protein
MNSARETLIKLEGLKNILVNRAVGQPAETDNDEYVDLRRELVADPKIRGYIPTFVVSCRTVPEFWNFIKTKFAHYQERREYLRDQFEPVLNLLEFGSTGPAVSSTQSAREAQQSGKATIDNVSGDIYGSVIAGGDITIGGASAPTQVSAKQSQPTAEYDLAAIYRLLEAAFTPQTLRRFCLFRSTFQPLVREFGPGHGLSEMVDRVIDYCNTRLLFDELQ